jgi:Divergent InlB B-repeat domain
MQLKCRWKGMLMKGGSWLFVLMMAAATILSGAKAGSLALTEAITNSAASSEVVLTIEKGGPGGRYEPGTQLVVSAEDPPLGAHFATWTGDVEILADPASAITTATIPFIPVKITATYSSPAAPTDTEPSPDPSQTPDPAATSAVEPLTAPGSSSAFAATRSWGG